jgi:hypothetical protein
MCCTKMAFLNLRIKSLCCLGVWLRVINLLMSDINLNLYILIFVYNKTSVYLTETTARFQLSAHLSWKFKNKISVHHVSLK